MTAAATIPQRLDAGAPAVPRRPSVARTCSECGEPFRDATGRGAFCGAACRKTWNNRRMVRGAELYDLVMALRFQRGPAQALKVWRLICRMASGFHHADRVERAGRPSWRPPAEVIARHPYLQATLMQRGR